METAASRRIRRIILAAIACLLATFAPRAALATSDGSSGDAAPPPVTANEFVPDDRDLSDCISALPKPDCGSEDRSGWRQGLVLALVLTGMAAIGARIVVSVRRRDRALAAQVDEVEEVEQVEQVDEGAEGAEPRPAGDDPVGPVGPVSPAR